MNWFYIAIIVIIIVLFVYLIIYHDKDEDCEEDYKILVKKDINEARKVINDDLKVFELYLQD